MAKLLSSAVTWIIVLLVAIIALLAGIAFGWFDTGDGTPSPGSSASATTSASPTPTAGPAFVERMPTEGDYVPSAEILTPDVLASAGSGWVVAIDNTSQINTAIDPHTVSAQGPTILYLISPAGVRYELANLDTIGLTAPDLVAWDYSRDLLLLEQDRTTLNVFDMATGSVASSWTFCASGDGYARYGEARDGNWLVRGGCQGDGIDGIYTDAGAPFTGPYPIVGLGTADLTVYDFGDTQVAYKFEGMVDEKYVAYYPDGTSASLPWNAGAYCDYPITKGRGDTLAMSCSSDTSILSIWELPIDGSLPYEVVSASQLEEFAMDNGGFGPGEFGIEGYWSDSALGIVKFWLGDRNPRLGVLYGGTVGAVSADVSYPFRRCHAVEGTSALVSGGGGLWWVDFDAGPEPIVMLPVMGSGSPIQTVGTDRYVIDMDDYTYTALRQP